MPWTASSLRVALESKGLRPKKGLGQHFLVDPNFCRFIVRAAELPADADVLEIGAGPGLLTAHLAPACARLTAVEIDPALVALCREVVGGAPHVEVVEADILDDDGKITFPLSRASGVSASEGDPERRRKSTALLAADVEGLHIFGNLPYNLSVPILVALLAWDRPVARILAVVQREVGERLRARPSTEAYGPLSVVARSRAAVDRIRAVPRTVFWPAPRVESELVSLTPVPGEPRRVRAAWAALQRLFRHRRKRLGATLRAAGLGADAARLSLSRAGASPDARAESLPPDVLMRLADFLSDVS